MSTQTINNPPSTADVTRLAQDIQALENFLNGSPAGNVTLPGGASVPNMLSIIGQVLGLNLRFQGAAASDPATRPDGSALQAGDVYYNTGSSKLRLYNGSAWADIDQSAQAAVSAASAYASAAAASAASMVGTQGVSAALASTQSIATGTGAWTTVLFTSNPFVDAAAFSYTAGTGVFLNLGGARRLTIAAYVAWASSSAGTVRSMRVRQYDPNNPGTTSVLFLDTRPPGNFAVNFSALAVQLSAGYAFVVEVQHDVGSSLNVASATLTAIDTQGVGLSSNSVTGLIDGRGVVLEPDAPYMFAFQDANGNMSFIVWNDGSVSIAKLSLSGALTTASVQMPNSQIYEMLQDPDAWYVEDVLGNKAVRVTSAGSLLASDFQASTAAITTLNGTPVANLIKGGSTPNPDKGFTAEINHVLVYGQSLSRGAAGTPIVTSAQRYDSLRFSGGVRADDNAGGSNYGSLIPLVEQLDPVGSGANIDGETAAGGCCDMIKQLIAAENGIAYTQQAYQLLASAPGFGGQTIAQLSPGSSYWTRLLSDLSNGYSLAAAGNKSYLTQAMIWLQGEADASGGTTQAAYQAAMVAMVAALNSAAVANNGQAHTVPMIAYQMTNGAGNGSPGQTIALAQLAASLADPRIAIACPLYPFDTGYYPSAPNTVVNHLSPLSYQLLGAYLGIACKRIVIDGAVWNPLRPISVIRQGKVILVKFAVPKPPLAFDTSWITVVADGNYGLAVTDSSLSPVTVSSVSIVEQDTVKIVTASPAGAGGHLRNGFGTGSETVGGRVHGQRSQLRDSQGNTVVFDGVTGLVGVGGSPGGYSAAFPMHNYSLVFDWQMS